MMNGKVNPLLRKNQLIANDYLVDFFIGANKHFQTYRVANQNNEFFNLHLILDSQFSLEDINRYRRLRAQLTTSLFPLFYVIEQTIIGNKTHFYIIEEFKTGEYLGDRLKRGVSIAFHCLFDMFEKLLQALAELDLTLSQPIIFNSINPANIWIDMSNPNENFLLTNFLHAHIEHEKAIVKMDEEYAAYQATEVLEGATGTVSSDLFSLAVVYYQLVYGELPWQLPLKDQFTSKEDWLCEVKKIRANEIKNHVKDKAEESRFRVLCKTLSEEPAKRFSTAREFLNLLRNSEKGQLDKPELAVADSKEFGFKAIAGMEALKDSLQKDVINVMKNRDKYREYGLDILNGLLLYGPPGCGKTFFAEKLAEEVAFSFFKIKPSDLQSKYINESQEKIKNLFDKAREKRPSIIFIDEIDAIAPSRSGHDIHHMHLSAVNELLVQMNNSGKDQVFVVAATNIPENIDPALLRTGRLDKKIYIPKPDKESRAKLFIKTLEDRPTEKEINFSALADITEDRIASDIKFICDEAARKALFDDRLISEIDLMAAIQEFSSSHFG